MTDTLATDIAAPSEKPMPARALNAIELRVLGTLIEKSLTTPEQYPLTLNSTRVGCNQKTSREPISQYDERAIGMAMRDLIDLKLVKEVFPPDRGAVKYEHRLGVLLDLRAPSVALLGVLMLRGLQTPGELRQNGNRMHAFESVEHLIDVLDRLAARSPALVQKLGRGPGQREDRYAQLLAGPPSAEAIANYRMSEPPAYTADDMAALRQEIAALRTRIEALEQLEAERNGT
ncbi:DUF480 domain-containing protein [bacterium]|nr:DUF480 domain-containing protein [bacterium]